MEGQPTVEMEKDSRKSSRISTILIVDDDADNLEVLATRLEYEDCRVLQANDGLTALGILEKTRCDLVVLDVMMPEMSGLDVLRAIRRTKSPVELPVIMATARDQSHELAEAFGLGANDYVTKPLDLVVLIARVQTQLSLKKSAEEVMELQHRLSERNRELERLNARLRLANENICRDLRAAARVQEAFLPNSYRRTPSLDFAWCFEPCEHLAGDFLNICPLDEDNVAFYVLDVSGHGVAAALLAMAAVRSLSQSQDPDCLLMRAAAGTGKLEPNPPAQVAERLTQKFEWDAQTQQFLTIFYAVVNTRTRVLTYASAGHPGAVLVNRDAPAKILDRGGPPISIGTEYSEYQVNLKPGDRVYLYSDGVTETMDADGELFGQDRLLESAEELTDCPLRISVSRLGEKLRDWRADAPSRDDVSILALECLPG